MSNISQEPVDASTHGVDEPTKQLLWEFAASLSHAHSVICHILEASGQSGPLPTLVFRDFVPANARWYSMIAGPNPGVYQGLQNLPNTSVSNVQYGRHASEEEARHAFNDALDKGNVRRISDGTTAVLTRADVYGA